MNQEPAYELFDGSHLLTANITLLTQLLSVERII